MITALVCDFVVDPLRRGSHPFWWMPANSQARACGHPRVVSLQATQHPRGNDSRAPTMSSLSRHIRPYALCFQPRNKRYCKNRSNRKNRAAHTKAKEKHRKSHLHWSNLPPSRYTSRTQKTPSNINGTLRYDFLYQAHSLATS